MTCHKYPGLVKYDKSDKYKVLHIDEEKHLESAHGKTDCKQCHPNTVKVPHTDVTEVECTAKCHLEDRENIEALDRSYYTDFHKEERFAITGIEHESSCRVCHPLYPHSENNKTRALVNMHTGFMLCEVCHLKKKNFTGLTYDWKEPEPFEFTGEPYGTHQKKEVKEKKKPEGVIQRMLRIFSEEDDTEEEKEKTHYLISRIAVFKKGKNGKTLFSNTADIKKAKEYLDQEGTLTQDEKKKKMDYFHRDIARKEISVACDECHSHEGILDFRKLGFSKNKTYDLEYLNIKGLVTKYDTFYIPNLFGH